MTTSVYLSPVFGAGAQLLNNSGVPLAGGKIYVYLSGSTTATNTYSDSAGTVLNPNPLILDSSGRLPTQIWLPTAYSYKFVVTDANGSSIGYTVDNVPGINDAGGAYAVTNEWNAGDVPTYVSADEFSVTGDQQLIYTPNRRIRCVCSAGLVYGYVWIVTYAVGITTVKLIMESGALDSGLSAVYYGFISATPTSLPANVAASNGNAYAFNSIGIGTGVLSSASLAGSYSVGVGNDAIASTTTGFENVAVGVEAMRQLTTGYQNVAIGYQAMRGLTIGYRNVSIGHGSNNAPVGNYESVSIGYNSMSGNLSSSTVAIGAYAGYNGAAFPLSTMDSIYIGYAAKNSTTSETNVILIGSNATSNGTNTITIGNSSHTDTYLVGRIRIPQYTTAGAPAYVKGALYFDTTLNKLRVGGATAWETVTSA